MTQINCIKNQQEYPQHSIPKSVVLHLLPGILITFLFIVLIPFMLSLGLLSNTAFLVAGLLILVIFEGGLILYQGKRRKGGFKLQGVIFYRKPLSLNQYFLFVTSMLVTGLLVSLILGSLISLQARGILFFWLPEWFVLTFSLEHPKAVLLINGSLSLIVNGVLGPLIEETYFRGYLLPRLSRLEKKGVFLNAILFAIYHFWTPWRVIELTLLTLVLGLIVWWKKNIFLGMLPHILGNVTSEILKIAAILIL